jgi:hypothetical protein
VVRAVRGRAGDGDAVKPRGMTAEDRAIYARRVNKAAAREYARAHAVDAKATDLWVKRAGYLDIERRVRCLAVVDSYWEVIRKNGKRRKQAH